MSSMGRVYGATNEAGSRFHGIGTRLVDFRDQAPVLGRPGLTAGVS